MSDIPFSVSMITAHVIFLLFFLLLLISLLLLVVFCIYFDMPSVIRFFVKEFKRFDQSEKVDQSKKKRISLRFSKYE